MRAATRLLASVQRGSQFLEPGTPTGITGLLTHASPRTTLLYHYSSTLDKLQQFPEHSVYRQSTEALTKHRLNVVESIKPAGLAEWQKRVAPIVDAHPQAFHRVPITHASSSAEFNVVWKDAAVARMASNEWGDDSPDVVQKEGIRTAEERKGLVARMNEDFPVERPEIPRIEPEPPLTAEQINEMEAKIGAGLIEEVLQVAEGESLLAETLLENKVYVGTRNTCLPFPSLLPNRSLPE